MTSPLNSCQTLRFSTDPPEFKIDYFEGKKKKSNPMNIEAVIYSVSSLF